MSAAVRLHRLVRYADAAHDDDGQSLVEIALSLPILLLIVIGLVDIGRVYYHAAAVTNAAREAAALAARDGTASTAAVARRACVELGADPIAGSCPATVRVQCVRSGSDCSTATAGGDVTVRVTYDLALLNGYLVGRVFQVNPVSITGVASFPGLGS
jgi:Flp pilus assembly protein TadG